MPLTSGVRDVIAWTADHRIGWRLGAAVLAAILAVSLAWTRPAAADPLGPIIPGQWHEYRNTPLGPHIGPVPAGSPPEYWSWTMQENITRNYSGGCLLGNELLVWGGGYGGWPRNSVFGFDLVAGEWTRLTDPSPYTDASVETLADGRPSARHTFDNLVCLDGIAGYQGMFSYGGSPWHGGFQSRAVWFFDRTDLEWSMLPYPRGSSDYLSEMAASQTALDVGRQRIMAMTKEGLRTFDLATQAWTWRATKQTAGGREYTMVFDPVRDRVVIYGRDAGGTGFSVVTYTITPSGVWPSGRPTLTGAAIPRVLGPSAFYHPWLDRYVVWTGSVGKTQQFYLIHPDTWVVSVLDPGTAGVVPTPGEVNGIHKRGSYHPELDAYVVFNDIDTNVFLYAFGSPTEPPVDEIAPVVSITSPAADGAIVEGNVNIGYTATDNVGVISVQILVGSSPLSGPTWDTTAVADGDYTITVRALDAAGNTGQAQRLVTVRNAPPPRPIIRLYVPTEVPVLDADIIIERGPSAPGPRPTIQLSVPTSLNVDIVLD